MQRIDGENSLLATVWKTQSIDAGGWDLAFRFTDSTLATLRNGIPNDSFSTGTASMGTAKTSVSVRWLQFPYWLVATPFTLISALLLLVQPRKSTEKKLPEPTNTEGAWTMREFFKGWRRKIGMVTLVMACVFAAGWVRSSFLRDWLAFSVGGDRFLSVASFSESLMLGIIRTGNPKIAATAPAWNTQAVKVDDEDPWNDTETKWIWRLHRFRYGEISRQADDFDVGMIFLPYWSIVLPLTAVAAYLLLSKPRKSTSKKIPEPFLPRDRES